MDEKTNFLSPGSSSPTPKNQESPTGDISKSLAGKLDNISSPAPNIKPSESTFATDQGNSPLTSSIKSDPAPLSKIGVESAFNEKSQDLSAELQKDKKSHVALWVLLIIVLVIIAAAGSGYAVYYMQTNKIQPLVKEKALLQGQAGNLKTQVDVLTKENTDLKSQIISLEEQLDTKNVAPVEGVSPGTPTGENIQIQPDPTVPVTVPESPTTPKQ